MPKITLKSVWRDIGHRDPTEAPYHEVARTISSTHPNGAKTAYRSLDPRSDDNE
jgi:hypothetical protein